MNNLNNTISNIKLGFNDLQQDTFKKVFTHIDQLGIRNGVDKLGIKRYIEQCARMSATTGVISGSGGAFTMIIGVPLDLLNLITQQIRVTLGVIYYTRGATYQITFDEFLAILANTLQVDMGITITKNLLERGAERILIKMGSKTAIRLMPLVGGLIGGATNYLFIKRIAASIIRMQPSYQTLPLNLE